MNVIWAKLLLGTARAASGRSIGIRWRRGFFRLWVVGSILWIAGVVIVDGLPSKPPPWAYDPIVPPNDLITPSDPQKTPNPFDQFDPPKTPSKFGPSTTQPVQRELSDPEVFGSSADAQHRLDAFLPEKPRFVPIPPPPPISLSRQIWNFCLKAFGAPAGTLVTWLVLAWVVEGFRPGDMIKVEAARQTNP